MMRSYILFCFVLPACFFTFINLCLALDDDSLQDTCPTATATVAQQPIFINGFPCKNPATVTPSDFKSSKLNRAGNTDNVFLSSTAIITALDFPGLNTLGLAAARSDLEVDGLVLPHSHPRASEMFYVSKGVVITGFIHTPNQLFQKYLRQGDVFVFPRVNAGFESAIVIFVLSSQNPGLVSIAGTMFETEPVNILTKRLISLSALGLERIDNVTLFRF